MKHLYSFHRLKIQLIGNNSNDNILIKIPCGEYSNHQASLMLDHTESVLTFESINNAECYRLGRE